MEHGVVEPELGVVRVQSADKVFDGGYGAGAAQGNGDAEVG